MPTFHYSALARDGQTISGQVASDTRQEAIARLAGQGSYVTDIGEAGAREEPRPPALTLPGARLGWGRRVSPRAKSGMLNQLATALQAGLPLLGAIRVVEQQADSDALRGLAADLASRVQAGESLSEAMRARGGEFSPLEVSMVRVGETAGVLDEVMDSLARFAERDMEFRQKLTTAAAYPLFVLGLAVLSMIVIVTVILPRILATVAEAAATLPWPTRVLMALSHGLRAWGWLLLILLVAGGWLFRNWLATPRGRLAFDAFKLRLPILGDALRRIAVARLRATLGTLYHSGIQILEAMQVLRGTLGNEALAQKIDQVTTRIRQGQSIAEPLRETGEFPPLLIQVIAMGERTGKLDELLLRLADAYEKETQAAVDRVMTLLPALLIVLMALLVAGILIAVLMPLVSLQLSPT